MKHFLFQTRPPDRGPNISPQGGPGAPGPRLEGLYRAFWSREIGPPGEDPPTHWEAALGAYGLAREFFSREFFQKGNGILLKAEQKEMV